MQNIKEKLDKDIGFYFWKYYIAGAFWSNIATPINLCITIMSALVSAQANSDDLLPLNIYKDISIGLLLLSTLNTFLRPHLEMNSNIEMKNKFDEFGTKFDEICYSNDDEITKNKKYQILSNELNKMRIHESPVSQNYLTDLIHIISTLTCLRNKDRWSDFYNFDEDNQNNVIVNDVENENNIVLTTDEENQES